MKFYLISDNVDTQMGMRLAGIEGVVVHQRDETLDALDKACADPDVAIILITAKLVELCREEIYRQKLTLHRPLIVEIPDRHGDGSPGESIARYIQEAIGITMEE